MGDLASETGSSVILPLSPSRSSIGSRVDSITPRQSSSPLSSSVRGPGASPQSRSSEPPEVVYVQPPEAKYMCPVCEKVLRYPVQFDECGHRSCTRCVNEIVRVAPRCPVDQTKVDVTKVFVDKAFQREIDALSVKCSNHAKGCKWTGTVGELVVHIEKCEHSVVECPKRCGLTFERLFLVRHVTEDCICRTIQCDFCSASIVFRDETTHMKLCDKFIIQCPNACKKQFPRDQLDAHLAECQMQVTNCPFVEAGCTFRGLIKNMEDHMLADFDNHYTMVIQILTTVGQNLTFQESAMTDRIDAIAGRVSRLTTLYNSPLMWCIEGWSNIYKKAKTGAVTQITSQFISTGRLGHRLVGVVCPYGDETAQGQFMSVYMSLRKTETDDLLVWPFTKRITITLIDQQDEVRKRKDVTYTIDAALEPSAVVGRPRERGPNFGIKNFIRLEKLNLSNTYVYNDTVYFRIQIED